MTPSPSRVARAGAAAVVAYLAAAAVTVLLAGRPVLPLFEGIGPMTPYRWVDPPPEFAVGNVPPEEAQAEVALGPSGSEAAGPATGDGQLVLALPSGAVPTRSGETAVLVRIVPLAPGDLGPTPAGLRPDGNAYRVEMSYQPSGTPVGALADEGNIVLSVPEPAAAVLYSADGAQWERLATAQLAGALSVGAVFARPGHYLAAAFPAPDPSDPGDGAVGVLAVAAVSAGLTAALLFGPRVVERVRERRTGR